MHLLTSKHAFQINAGTGKNKDDKNNSLPILLSIPNVTDGSF